MSTGDEDADPRSDRDLLEAHVAGDPDAFGVLFTRHRTRMWAVALRTVRDPEEAADAVQDAAISAFRRADTFRGEAAVTTWLHRIVVNACLDRLRRRAARPADPLTDADGNTVVEPVEDDHSDRRQTQLDVHAALGHLNPDQRAALVLVDMEGWGVEDAAAALGCAVGTVKSRCARGRARLAELLGQYAPDTAARPAAGGNRDGRRCVAGTMTTAQQPVAGGGEVTW